MTETTVEAAGTPAVEAAGIEVAFGDTVVLTDVSFSVSSGEIFAVLGGSGSGKSTLLRVLLGLLHPNKGVLRLRGRDLGEASDEERAGLLSEVGVLFQSGALFGSLTLAENVALPLEAVKGFPKAAVPLLARLKLALVGLDGHEDQLPSEISGGMRKRAGIARAMALDPSLLVLDEPSSGLDPVTAGELDRLILTLNRTLGITVIMVTHDLASAFATAGRCILIDAEAKGILAEGRPQELQDHADPRVRAFFRRGE